MKRLMPAVVGQESCRRTSTLSPPVPHGPGAPGPVQRSRYPVMKNTLSSLTNVSGYDGRKWCIFQARHSDSDNALMRRPGYERQTHGLADTVGLVLRDVVDVDRESDGYCRFKAQ